MMNMHPRRDGVIGQRGRHDRAAGPERRALAVTFLTIAVLGGSVWAEGRSVPPRGHWLTTSTPLPPPPKWASGAILTRFYSLYLPYLALPPRSKPSFAEWLELNDVVDPHLKAQLLALYAWYADGPPSIWTGTGSAPG